MYDLQARARPGVLTFTSDQLMRVINEYELQTAVSEAQSDKSAYCMRLLAELHQLGYINSKQTMDWIVALDTTVEYPAPYGDMWRQFRHSFIESFLDTMLKANRIAAKNIVMEVDRSLYLPPLPPKQPGLIARLLAAITEGNAR